MKKKTRGGFTLIELAIGILVMGFCGLAVMTLFIEGASQAMRGEVLTIGKALIQQEMEDVLLDAFPALASRALRAYASPFGSYTVTVQVSYVASDLVSAATSSEYKRIRVSLSHPLISPMVLETIVSDYKDES